MYEQRQKENRMLQQTVIGNSEIEPAPERAWALRKGGESSGIQTMAADDGETDETREVNVPISLSLFVIIVYVLVGAGLFAAWNEWTFITGAYFRYF